MLQQIREKAGTKFFYYVLMILIILGMAMFGLGDYSFGGSQPYVAKVGDEIISENAFAARVDENRRQMRSMMGASYNAKMFDTPEYRRRLLDQMIDEELISQAGAAAGMAVSDARLRDEIFKIESFQRDGKFDNNLYVQLLQANSMSVTQFQERIRRDLAVRELPSQISSTSLVTGKDVDAFVRLRDQLRSFRYASLPSAVVAPESITDAAVKQYFDGHSVEYVHPEQLSIEYVELDGNALRPVGPLEESVLRARYTEQSDRFGTKEQRLASHILIEVAENANADAEKTAKQKADAIVSELNAGKIFAEVAQASSEDIGSKASGGDLGWIERGSMEPTFEEALFALESGKVSAPVRTTQGYHVIELREIRPAAIKSFEEVRAELDAEMIEEQRLHSFTEAQDKLFEAADQNTGTLEPMAKAINGQVQTSELFSREGGNGIAAFPEIREAAFSPEVKDDGLTSELIELSNDRIVVLRLAERKPSKPRTFDETKDQIRSLLLSEAVAKNAREAGDAALKRLLGGESLETIAASAGVAVVDAADSGRQGIAHDSALLAEAFKLPRPAQGAVSKGLAKINDTGYALIELRSVVDGDITKLDDAARTAARDQLKQELAATEAEAFLKALRARTAIKIDETKV